MTAVCSAVCSVDRLVGMKASWKAYKKALKSVVQQDGKSVVDLVGCLVYTMEYLWAFAMVVYSVCWSEAGLVEQKACMKACK